MRVIIFVMICLVTPLAFAATVTITAPDAVVERVLNFGCRYRGPCEMGTPSERFEQLRQKVSPEAQVSVTWDAPSFDSWRDKDGVPFTPGNPGETPLTGNPGE